MKGTFALVAGLAIVSATPVRLRGRQATGQNANDVTNGVCRQYTLIFARGSTEQGNMGASVGPPTCDGLKQTLGATNVACQGVGGAYKATLQDNTLANGTSTAAVTEAVGLFNKAVMQCPNTTILASGYSQGAAVMHAAAKSLSPAIVAKVAAVQTYGDTRNAEDKGTIPPFPKSQTKIICNANDGVCGNQLQVTAGHLQYTQHVGEAVAFLAGAVKPNTTTKAKLRRLFSRDAIESSAPAAESSVAAATGAPAAGESSTPTTGGPAAGGSAALAAPAPSGAAPAAPAAPPAGSAPPAPPTPPAGGPPPPPAAGKAPGPLGGPGRNGTMSAPLGGPPPAPPAPPAPPSGAPPAPPAASGAPPPPAASGAAPPAASGAAPPAASGGAAAPTATAAPEATAAPSVTATDSASAPAQTGATATETAAGSTATGTDSGEIQNDPDD